MWSYRGKVVHLQKREDAIFFRLVGIDHEFSILNPVTELETGKYDYNTKEWTSCNPHLYRTEWTESGFVYLEEKKKTWAKEYKNYFNRKKQLFARATEKLKEDDTASFLAILSPEGLEEIIDMEID